MKKNRKKYFIGNLILFLSIVALVAPLGGLFIHNYDIWVKQDATKITTGVMIGLVYTIFVVKGALKEISKKSATLLSMLIFAGIVWFLNSMIDQLFTVIIMVIIGYILFWILSNIGNNMVKTSKVYKEEKIRVSAREEANSNIMGV